MRLLISLALILLCNLQAKEPNKKVYISPGAWGQLFAFDSPIFNRDGGLDVLYQLRKVAIESGYDLIQANSFESLSDFEYLIVFEINVYNLPYLAQYPKEKLVLFLWEPPTIIPENYEPEYHEYFSKVYTWNDSLVDNQKYFKFYYPRLLPMLPDLIDFDSRRLSTLITFKKESSYPLELLSERRRVIDFFETLPPGYFDLYGSGWSDSLKNYQGPITRKVDILKYYKFSFCYENTKGTPGYITEKIFDSFQAGTVPVYLGAPNVADYIPKNCFVAREDFPSMEALFAYLDKMTKEEHQQYLNNIERFLKSEKAHLFSPEHFIHIFMDLLRSEALK